ncbi:MAG: ComEA family DNA-binding protein [Woeseiaceae bacterium]|nr:ComEA family DNA-binding protein [Woeseiaceae bacterium]
MNIFRKSVLVLVLAAAWPLVSAAGPVDINTADAATISAELKGIGLSKAQAIVDYRRTHGPFKTHDDLTLVKGIGERTVEMNRANIRFGAAANKK